MAQRISKIACTFLIILASCGIAQAQFGGVQLQIGGYGSGIRANNFGYNNGYYRGFNSPNYGYRNSYNGFSSPYFGNSLRYGNYSNGFNNRFYNNGYRGNSFRSNNYRYPSSRTYATPIRNNSVRRYRYR